MLINYTDEVKDFTESQLIAYIGNKRRLLPLIQKAFGLLDLQPDKKKLTFYDPFAGTGVISRFAKSQGFQVIANDWEPYSQTINKVYIETNQSELDDLFQSSGGINKILSELNNLPSVPEKELYIARYYCPKSTDNPDLKNERLFYTREAGEKIDAIRKAIDELPCDSNSKTKRKKQTVLLSLLLYEAATRANTSGVFKAFHQGFGGLGKDALGRILKPLKLTEPKLFNGQHRCKVFKACANKLTKKLCSRIKFDVVYLDPPYNQHQYGSNYHLLNTIALNDKPPVNEAIYINGKKVAKSAIRKDWIKTKSSYCYKSTAAMNFRNLIHSLNAHYILISYSIDGIVPFDDMLSMLSNKGKLSIVTSEYTKYRGGKQALTSEKSNIEFLLVVDTSKAANADDITKIKECLIEQKIQLYLKKNIDQLNASALGFSFSHYANASKYYTKQYSDWIVQLSILNDFQFNAQPECLAISSSNNKFTSWLTLPFQIKKELAEDLGLITSITKDREIEIILSLIENLIYFPLSAQIDEYLGIEKLLMNFYKKIPILLKKFNNRKAYKQSLKTINQIIAATIIIREELPALYYSDAFQKLIAKLKDIIENKINHKPDQEIDEINKLKIRVKKQYKKALGAA